MLNRGRVIFSDPCYLIRGEKADYCEMKLRILVLLILAFFLAIPLPTQADTLTYNLNYVFSGQTPSGPSPWLTATFTDTGLNTVRLTMDASGLSGSEFVDGKGNDKGWFFNLDPTKDPTKLTFVFVSGNDANSIVTGTNAFKADGDGSYDILFQWDPKPEDRLIEGQTAVCDITSSEAGLLASWFDYLSEPSPGSGFLFHSAAHVQGIGPGGEDSGWIGDRNGGKIPEPSTLLLIGSGLLGLALCARKRP